MRNGLDKSCEENEYTNLWAKLSSENHAVYERMWKNAVEPDRTQMAI
jgi:hypothetical protein